jgi:predicted ester cyclase
MLQQSKANLDANADMFRTVWDTMLNAGDIDLMNSDSFDL